MAISNLFAAGTFAASRQSDRLQNLRTDLADLNRQLATGKRHETLGAMRRGRSSVLDMRSDLAALEGFRAVAKRGTVRIGLMTDTLTQITTLAAQGRNDALTSGTPLTPGGIASASAAARGRMEQAVSQLNSDMDGQYLFGGRKTDTPPVLPMTTLMAGTGGAAGVATLMDERRQADRGDGLGRLLVGASGVFASISEEATGLPFGFKLTGASTNSAGIGVAGPSGVPAGVSFVVSGSIQDGESLSVDLALPDGSNERISLAARSNAAGGIGTFAIGSNAAATAANIGSALATAIREKADAALSAASGMVAAEDFFAGSASVPPRRIAGPPFASASGFAASGSRPTMIWYQGDDDPAVSARGTQLATIDRGVTVGAGARANEAPLRRILAGMAVVAQVPIGTTSAGFRAISERSAGALAQGSDPAISSMTTELASASAAMGAADMRHANRAAVYQGAISEVEQPSLEELSTSILALQTRLQASYQVTASISKLSLSQYL